MNTPKLKWKVQAAPTGKYRSFERRGWPNLEASYGGSDRTYVAAYIECDDDYRPSQVMTGDHAELAVRVYDHREGWHKRKCPRLKARFTNLADAKKAAEEFLLANPQYLPTPETPL